MATATTQAAAMQAPLRIASSRTLFRISLRELWAYRELLYFFVWRDLKVRYKQTAIGAAWAILQPFFTMLVFSLFFGRLAKLPTNGLPYPILLLCAFALELLCHGLTERDQCRRRSAAVDHQGLFSASRTADLRCPFCAG